MTAVSQTSFRVVRMMYHQHFHPLSPLTHSASRSKSRQLRAAAFDPLHPSYPYFISDKEKLRQDEARRAELQVYCFQMEEQRQLNDDYFMQLLSMIAPKLHQVQQTVTPERQASAARQFSTVPPVATTFSCPHGPITALLSYSLTSLINCSVSGVASSRNM